MKQSVPFHVNAARFSWMAPVGAICLNCFFRILVIQSMNSQNPTPNNPADVDKPMLLIGNAIGLLLIVSGLIAGIIALCGIKKHGARQIAVPAVAGIAINVCLIAAAVGVVARFH